ncbi:MAG: GNAT family N-acetyltransferase, partial [Kiritimatiellae bacterium]|nr:GNAT family N-acetyltransferase [Kiritimatiellia bacterium]
MKTSPPSDCAFNDSAFRQVGEASYAFEIVRGDALTDGLCRELATVFSTSYGRWSADVPPPRKPGGRIRMRWEAFREWYDRPEYRFALCRSEGRLVGQAIYLERETSRGKVAFVVQLVVDEAHRHRGMATSLLHAIWGFSNHYAWGIVTSSPCTVEALEGATFRSGLPDRILQDSEFIRGEILSHIDFLKDAEWTIDSRESFIDTQFFTDRTNIIVGRKNVPQRYGALPSGQEWLAVIFRDQLPDQIESFSRVVERSSLIVADAYLRMPQATQPWAGKAVQEIDTILSLVPEISRGAAVCDFGSGSGRHVKAFRDRGFTSVAGIDLAVTEAGAENGVETADCRTYRAKKPCDLITCLYDVVGSFSEDAENRKLVENIKANLAPSGYAVISVANSEYAEKQGILALDDPDPAQLLAAVFALSPSNAMISSGEFFEKGGVWDKSTGLFYHKEQFPESSSGLRAEYLVVDRRYTLQEITGLLDASGLEVVTSRYVRAG